MSATKVLLWFIFIFTILWCFWFITGGPQKEDSNKAFIKIPDGGTNTVVKYGTIETLDKLDRSR